MYDGKKKSTCKTDKFFTDIQSIDSCIKSTVHRVGCLTVLDHIYNQEVLVLLEPIYMLASIFVGVLELLSGVFAIIFFKELSKAK